MGEVLRSGGMSTTIGAKLDWLPAPPPHASGTLGPTSDSEWLLYQNQSLKKKNELLAELANLSVFSFRRRKQLRLTLDKLV